MTTRSSRRPGSRLERMIRRQFRRDCDAGRRGLRLQDIADRARRGSDSRWRDALEIPGRRIEMQLGRGGVWQFRFGLRRQ